MITPFYVEIVSHKLAGRLTVDTPPLLQWRIEPTPSNSHRTIRFTYINCIMIHTYSTSEKLNLLDHINIVENCVIVLEKKIHFLMLRTLIFLYFIITS